MSNLTADERQYISLPAAAREQTCGGCGGLYEAVRDSICGDEGDGSAMVDLVCDCGCSSAYSWTLSDVEYQVVFGRGVDEDYDDEDYD